VGLSQEARGSDAESSDRRAGWGSSYGPIRVAVGALVYKHKQANIAAVKASLAAPDYLLKIIPHVDGSPRICELVEYYPRDIDLKGAWTGPAQLNPARAPSGARRPHIWSNGKRKKSRELKRCAASAVGPCRRVRHEQVLKPFVIDALFDRALPRHANRDAVSHGELGRLDDRRTKSLDSLLKGRGLAFQFGDRRKPECVALALWLASLLPKLIGASTDGLFNAAHD